MDTITLFVGWMFIIGFAITMILTLVALTLKMFQLRPVDDKYLKPLFGALILEMIGCVVFLFWAGFGTLELEPNIAGGVHFFDAQGRPLTQAVNAKLGTRVIRTFEPIPNLANIQREIDSDLRILVNPAKHPDAAGRPEAIPFGILKEEDIRSVLPDVPEELDDPAPADLTVTQHYYVGMYASQLRPGSSERVDPLNAKIHLLKFMRSDRASRTDKGKAISRLYFVMNELDSCAEFRDLTHWTNEFRQNAGITRYQELGEIHLESTNRPGLLNDDSQDRRVRSAALGQFLSYLGAADENNPDLRPAISRALQRSEELAGCPDTDEICSALSTMDTTVLKKKGKELTADSAATTFACSS